MRRWLGSDVRVLPITQAGVLWRGPEIGTLSGKMAFRFP